MTSVSCRRSSVLKTRPRTARRFSHLCPFSIHRSRGHSSRSGIATVIEHVPLQYLDTSALVKRYLADQGSGWIRALMTTELVAASDLTTTEIASILARRVREGTLAPTQANELFATFLR